MHFQGIKRKLVDWAKANLPMWMIKILVPVYSFLVGGSVLKAVIPARIDLKKDQYKGKRCFIIGGGPSILKHDLSLLNDEYTFIVNKGFALKERGLKKATFYGMSDKHAYENYGDNIDPNYIEHFITVGNVPWDKKVNSLTVLSSYTTHDWFKKLHKGFWQDDITKPLSGSYTVVLYMLQVAVWLGFTEIYFIGVDNDFTGNNLHWYKDSKKEKENIKLWSTDNTAMTSKAFKKVDKILRKKGVRIYNAGLGGKLNTIERVNYQTILEKK